MTARHDPGLERRARRIGRKGHEGIVLEHDARTGTQLVVERPAEDAATLLLVETLPTLQLLGESRRDQADRIELRMGMLQRRARRATVVIEDRHMLEIGILGVMAIAIDVRLDDLL